MSDGWAVRVSRSIAPGNTLVQVWYVRHSEPKPAIAALRGLLNLTENDANVAVVATDQVLAEVFEQMGVNPGGIRPM